MTRNVFVTGMLRSGTSLMQTLLTNHSSMFVCYQPFNRLYVETKRLFLGEHGLHRELPLDDGSRPGSGERSRFTAWLRLRRFTREESIALVAVATAGKGGSMSGWIPEDAPAGTFSELWQWLHERLVARFREVPPEVTGSKEILCEEFVPFLLESGTACILVIRDPRAVIASANSGRYRELVGDRYPIMMLVRLWRKSAAYWLHYKDHPLVQAVRYEDVADDPNSVLQALAKKLDLPPFSERILGEPLLDHAGIPWVGNSSYGDKSGIDQTSTRSWQSVLPDAESRFIAACTRWELDQIGYARPNGLTICDIQAFQEDTCGVRASYLRNQPLDDASRLREVERFEALQGGDSAWYQGNMEFPYRANVGNVVLGA